MKALDINNITPRQTKNFAILIVILSAAAWGILFYQGSINDYRILKWEDKIDLKVTKITSYKGGLIMNDSVVVSGNLPLIVEKSKMINLSGLQKVNPEGYSSFKMTLSQVTSPYRITKEASSDTIVVYHYNDTLYFKLFLP